MARSQRWLFAAITASLVLGSARAALAHPGHLQPGSNGFAAGMLHPLTGFDHLLAMLASGLLAVRIGTRRALWLVPAAFVGLMLLGGGLAYIGLPLPRAEWGISASVLVLGLMVALLPRIPLSVGVGCVGLFALFHGHAHVAELGGQALLPYMAGFVLTTLALHAGAIASGTWAVRAERPGALRFAGAAVAVGFALLLCAS
jgi:urease accessory protein